MKIRIIVSLLLAFALTLTNSNTALSEEKSESAYTNSSEVCIDENGNKYPCPD
ncbi:MAG: hypothetical protein F6K35_24280 [Okeania sp. SIO2H7]|nr:hypothetical protein [Okeania sp. SIO2H7]